MVPEHTFSPISFSQVIVSSTTKCDWITSQVEFLITRLKREKQPMILSARVVSYFSGLINVPAVAIPITMVNIWTTPISVNTLM